MSRYVDADTFEVFTYTKTEEQPDTFDAGVQFVLEKIDKTPTADVAPVVHAQWIGKCEDTRREYICSKCERSVFLQFSHAIKDEPALLKVMYPYCHCGAKMDEVVPNDD